MEASLSAQLLDLIGPEDANRRPTLRQARDRCKAGEVVAARDRGVPVVVVRLRSGALRVFRDRCPHDGGPLSDGFLDGDVLVCSRHGWEFDPDTGERVCAPNGGVSRARCEFYPSAPPSEPGRARDVPAPDAALS